MKELYNKYREFIIYIVVGVMTTIVSLGVYYALVFTILNPNDAIQLQIANIVSWICAVLFAYVTNRIFVFQSKNRQILKEMSQFIGGRFLTLLIDMGMMFFFVTYLGFSDKIIKLIVQVVVFVANYLLSKLLVFTTKKK